jgi:hypothetical protein
MRKTELVFQNCVLLKETTKAYKVSHPDHEDAWFPKSLSVFALPGTLGCSYWIAEQKKWFYPPEYGASRFDGGFDSVDDW